MSDTVNTIIDAVKEMVHDMGDKVTTAVKESLHVPDNMGPLITTLKDLVITGQKFATGEGSVDELSGLTTKLGNFSAMVDTLENGPLKKMVLTLRDQAMAQLKDVKGAEKIVKILAVLGETGKGDSAPVTPSASPTPPVVEAPIVTPAAAAPAAPAVAEPVVVSAPTTTNAAVATAVEEAVAPMIAAVSEAVPAPAPTATVAPPAEATA